ncbi:MAG: hypothetical protein GEU81_09750 [Nitriliruptorales bacterium]|nr:hypothetical protein [Nitriliruptorales bacterium]
MMLAHRLSGVLFVAVAVLLAACGGGEAGDTDQASAGDAEGGAGGEDMADGIIEIEMSDTPAITTGGVLMVAEGMGFDEENGLSLERASYAGSAAQGEAIAAGGHEFGHIADSTFATLYDAGVPIRVLSQSVDSSRQIQLVAREELGIESPEDLEGLTFGLTFGSGADVLLSRILDNAGIDQAAVEKVDLTPPDIVSTYARGDIDAYVTWPPALVEAQREVDSVVLHDSQDSYFPADSGPDQTVGTHILVWATEDFIASNPEAVQRYFAMARQTIDFINDPESRPQAIDVISETLDTDRDIVEQTVEEWITYQLQIDDTMLQNLEDTAQFLRERDALTQDPAVQEWFDTGPLKEFDASLIETEVGG